MIMNALVERLKCRAKDAVHRGTRQEPIFPGCRDGGWIGARTIGANPIRGEKRLVFQQGNSKGIQEHGPPPVRKRICRPHAQRAVNAKTLQQTRQDSLSRSLRSVHQAVFIRQRQSDPPPLLAKY